MSSETRTPGADEPASGKVQVHDFSDVSRLSPASAEEANRKASAEASAREVLTREAVLSNYSFVQKQPYATLKNGNRMPLVGLGTWNAPKGEVGAAVSTALRCGYRHVDCAAVYGNEREVGEALTAVFDEGVVERDELFVTSKLWNTEHSPGRVPVACGKTLADLQLKYLDLYLMHWPVTGVPGPTLTPSISDTWAAMEKLVHEGLVRSIGVSNFSIKKLEALLDDIERRRKAGEDVVLPSVLQVEIHPYFRNDETIAFAHKHGIHVTAYSPLGSPDSAAATGRKRPRPRLLRDEVVASIAERYGKTVSQVLVKWAVQRGTSCLPKSTNPAHIRENVEASVSVADESHPGLEWTLSDEDMSTLSSFEPQIRMVDGSFFVNPRGPYTRISELWDDPIEDSREDTYVRSLYDLEIPKRVPVASIRAYDSDTRQEIHATVPLLGLGTFLPGAGGKLSTGDAVAAAIRMGYRHIDCAAFYGNERDIGTAVADLLANEGLVCREDLFFTSKLWNDAHRRVAESCRKTLADLQLSYLDLYLMHWPITDEPGEEVKPPLAETWKDMEKLVHEGLVRSIGVSNFSIKKLGALLDDIERRRKAGEDVVLPAVLQIEAHPYFRNDDLIAFARRNRILVTAYSPFGRPDSTLPAVDSTQGVAGATDGSVPSPQGPLGDPVIVEAAKKLNLTPSQLILKWAIQRGTNPIPKSTNLDRMRNNLQSVDIQIPDEVMARINNLPFKVRTIKGDSFIIKDGPYHTLAELWDDPDGL